MAPTRRSLFPGRRRGQGVTDHGMRVRRRPQHSARQQIKRSRWPHATFAAVLGIKIRRRGIRRRLDLRSDCQRRYRGMATRPARRMGSLGMCIVPTLNSCYTAPMYRRTFTIKSHPLADTRGRVHLHRMVLWDKLDGKGAPCYWCQRDLVWRRSRGGADTLNADHLDGDQQNNDPNNLVPSCRGCNGNRGRKPVQSIQRGRVCPYGHDSWFLSGNWRCGPCYRRRSRERTNRDRSKG